MGCGKSSVGRRLSELLCCPFMDLDSVIEEQAGRSIAEIFASDGEASFRQMEMEALRSIILGNSCESVEKQSVPQPHSKALVLSLGGGVVMTPECAELVNENTVCIYLRTSTDTLVARLAKESTGRPLLNTGTPVRHRIGSMMAQRTSTYEATAHHIIDTDGISVDELAHSIISVINR